MKRPLSVTIIAWWLILGSLFSLYSALTLESNPMAQDFLQRSALPSSIHVGLGVVGAIVSGVCGYGILKGKDWSRVFYTGWGLLMSVFGFVAMPFPSMSLLGLIFAIVFAFFLFRPPANVFFGKDWLATLRAPRS